MNRVGAAIQKKMAYLTGRWWFWLAVMAVPFSWPFYYVSSKDEPPPLMTYGEIPEFDFVDQYGREYGSEELRGRTWVGAFFFTRCATACPRIMEKMREIQHRSRHLGHEEFHIVGFSVDPEHDTPEVLKKYAEENHMSRTGWTLLTGDTAEVQNVTITGFRVARGRKVGTDHEYEGLFHGTHFVLVDRNMKIRGFYASDDEDAIKHLLHDAKMAILRGG